MSDPEEIPKTPTSKRINIDRFLKTLKAYYAEVDGKPRCKYKTLQGVKVGKSKAICGCCAATIYISGGKVRRKCRCHTYDKYCYMCGHCWDHCPCEHSPHI